MSDPLRPGTLDAEGIRALAAAGGIGPIDPRAVQPASLDLRLGAECYRLPGSLLPLPGERVRDLVASVALERIDLSRPACLGRGQVHVVRLQERPALPPGMAAYCNGKSSTGRVDLATRVLADGSPRYDRIPAGYTGDLWVELVPRSFAVVAQAGISLTQAIFFHDRQVLGQAELAARHAAAPLAWTAAGPCGPEALHDGRLLLSADLDRPVVGWVAKRTHLPVDLSAIAAHDPDDFFTPLPKPRGGMLYLEQDRFYILATRERVVVPLDLACEMVPFDPSAGEFRAHYAGFFDPGWGVADGGRGLPAVLEVRPHSDDLILRHRQPICAMAYERLTAPCADPYGSCGNTYADQDGPRLSKHFTR